MMKKSEQIKQLTERIEALEQYSKIDNIVVSGLDTRLYSSTTLTDESSAQTGEPTKAEMPVVENAVLSLFNDELQAEIKETDISVVHYSSCKKIKQW